MKEFKISQSITPRESENISRYFANIASSHPLDPEQEADLALRIHKGDLQARNELVTANLRFVVSVAKQYQNLGVPLDDLINEGNIGLIRAAERFDPTKGFKFATFADVLSRIRNAANAFEQENQRIPSIEELAEKIGMDVAKLEEYLGRANSTISIDAQLSADSDATVGEMLPDISFDAADETLMAESLQHDLQVALNSIPRREQDIPSTPTAREKFVLHSPYPRRCAAAICVKPIDCITF